MKKFLASLDRSLIALALAAAAAAPVRAETAVPVQDFSVFVDLQTGFAFVKTPAGWHFVRRIEADRLPQLHPTTLVSVMQAGERLGDRLDDRVSVTDAGSRQQADAPAL